ncbi:MAG: 2-succinyl-5-enolpyruvyl-6-hydroxy-3-cyclohexene-1-carboxylic-acid synthase [Leptothrix sp. (in: Bacteria)]|nr:2-succinyl-5-enolpyruvyl-6-hydroxy-3-cyclohexene-1-carboxylic-acid synthase [Leptothrix sp. (in: b-proteobacteria)]
MTPPVPENLLALWSRLLFDSLAAAGVRDVVVSPGSRSTPFVLAAAAEPRLRLHSAIDERAAAFFALGQARVTGMPSLLLCTSGSAGAHYLPAVIEADQAGVPLLILTADRPTELLHVAANQTIDQRWLFEGYARRVVDVGAPDASPAALRGLRRLAAQAVALAQAPQPGAVHLNLRARKPLEPVAALSAAALALDAAVRALMAAPAAQVVVGRPAADDAAMATLAQRCLRARRGVIVAGPAPASQARARTAVARLQRATGFALLAEGASQLRFAGAQGVDGAALIDGFDWLYRLPAGDREWLPDLVIQLGAPPTSGAWERLLDRHGELERIVVAPTGWPDPHNSAAVLVQADIEHTCDRLAAMLARGRAQASEAPAFTALLAAANARARRVVDAQLQAQGDTLSEGAAARCVAAGLAPGSWLVVGNSLPIRLLDAYAGPCKTDLHVLSQRGASGIDGLVSGAAGAATVAASPVVLLVGDVSALHDVGGLALAAAARVPLVIVVVNNDGGRIFEQLPVARVADGDTMRRFTTPHGLDFAAAARLYRHPFERVATRPALQQALAAALGRNGCTLIEAQVPAHGAAEDQARIVAALAAPDA